MRADALRHQEKLLVAARAVFAERGSSAPLDEIARRAGVGIGTLYRRFPDRAALIHGVVADALARTEDAATQALEREPDGFSALTRYMHSVLDLRVSAVIPALMDTVDLEEPTLAKARNRSAKAVQRIVDAAHGDGTLPEEVTFGDVGTLLVRLSRPLPGSFSPELDTQLAHRHLDLAIEGLRASTGRRAVTAGPALSREDLRALRKRMT